MSYGYKEDAEELLKENIKISYSLIGAAIIFPNNCEAIKSNLKYVNESLSRLSKIFESFKSKIPKDDLGKRWKKDIGFLEEKIKTYKQKIENITSNFKFEEAKELIDNLYNFSVINNSYTASISNYNELIKKGLDGLNDSNFKVLENTLIALYKIYKKRDEKVILINKDPKMIAHYEDCILTLLEYHGYIPLTEYIKEFFRSEEELERVIRESESTIRERDKSEYHFYTDGGNEDKISQTFFTLKLNGFSIYEKNSYNVVDVVKSYRTRCRPEITTRKLKKELIR
jgi:hypothetical protein